MSVLFTHAIYQSTELEESGMSKAINFPAEIETILPSDRDDADAIDLEDLDKDD
ncbi:MAG: hypothetical protein HC770_04520, partial [Pseudanabaena sp. CRU_2_10]|nr:hypothetical protein [Pseudanabaena sp. CRU_2_10]